MDFLVDRDGADGEPPVSLGENDGELETILFGDRAEIGEENPVKRKGPESGANNSENATEEPRAAWVDDDDFGGDVSLVRQKRLKKLRTSRNQKQVPVADYEKALRLRFAQTARGSGAWATAPKQGSLDHELDSDLGAVDKLLKIAGVDRCTGKGLPGGTIDIKRTLDANRGEPSKSVIRTVEFHPSSAILMTAGFDKRVRLFQVDGVSNKKIHSVYTPDMPIHKAHFTRGGGEVVCSGRKPFFYQYDLETGRAARVSSLQGLGQQSWENFSVSPDGSMLGFTADNGRIILVSNSSKQQVGVLKMSGQVRMSTFSAENQVYCFCGDSRVYGWDLRMQRCFLSFADDAGISGTALASSTSGLLACGSDAGVVNIYENPGRTGDGSSPKLIKSVDNLTTSITSLEFSGDSEMLAISSMSKHRAFRLLHTGTMTVFANWPTTKTGIRRVTDSAFSADGSTLALGNDAGLVPTFTLKHYLK